MARRLYPLEAGERDRWIRLEQADDGTGSGGFPIETWSQLVDLFAMKEDIRGAERAQADGLTSRYDTRWEINYREDMDPELIDVPKTRRLVYQDRTYDIVAASMIGRREGVELLTIASTRS